MSSKSTFSNSTSKSYALALYELAKENSEINKVEEGINGLKALLNKSSNFKEMILNPVIRKEEKKKVIFEIAKQYNKIANFESADYEASIKSFDLFLLEYPGTTFREEAMYYRLDSAYNLAVNSIKSKKEGRLNSAITYYKSFAKAYPNSKHKETADAMNAELTAQLSQLSI